jgi:hypothetical protein
VASVNPQISDPIIQEIRITHSGLTVEARRTGHRGWPQILARLQAYTERFERKVVS